MTNNGSPARHRRRHRLPMGRRWAIGIFVAVGLLFGGVLAPAVMPGNAMPRPAASCEAPVAGWTMDKVPCHRSYLPRVVRQCLFGVGGAALVSAAVAGATTPAVLGALVGCGGQAFR